MPIDEFNSVKKFLKVNQNVIRFAAYIRAEDLLNNIASLIVSINISDFDSFWIDLIMTFEENGVLNVGSIGFYLFVDLASKLLLAAEFKRDTDLFKKITEELARGDFAFSFEDFLNENDLSDESIQVILNQWIQ